MIPEVSEITQTEVSPVFPERIISPAGIVSGTPSPTQKENGPPVNSPAFACSFITFKLFEKIRFIQISADN